MTTEDRAGHIVSVDVRGYPSTGNARIDKAVSQFIDTEVERVFRSEVEEWSAANTGRLRTRLAIRRQIGAEIAVLCEALGGWALVPGSDLFPLTEEEDPPWGIGL